jgi:hypothetical protein
MDYSIYLTDYNKKAELESYIKEINPHWVFGISIFDDEFSKLYLNTKYEVIIFKINLDLSLHVDLNKTVNFYKFEQLDKTLKQFKIKEKRNNNLNKLV